MLDDIRVDPEIQSGTPCFAGTRVPLKNFFDHIEAGYSIDGFLKQFPSVQKMQVIRLVKDLAQLSDDLLAVGNPT